MRVVPLYCIYVGFRLCSEQSASEMRCAMALKSTIFTIYLNNLLAARGKSDSIGYAVPLDPVSATTYGTSWLIKIRVTTPNTPEGFCSLFCPVCRTTSSLHLRKSGKQLDCVWSAHAIKYALRTWNAQHSVTAFDD